MPSIDLRASPQVKTTKTRNITLNTSTHRNAAAMSIDFEPDINFNSKPSADRVPNNILEDLKNQFVCGSCKTNLLPPIKKCKKDHNICEKCKMYSTCAVCDIATQKVLRNVELEDGRAKVYNNPCPGKLKLKPKNCVPASKFRQLKYIFSTCKKSTEYYLYPLKNY